MKTGFHFHSMVLCFLQGRVWIPAFAGMTMDKERFDYTQKQSFKKPFD